MYKITEYREIQEVQNAIQLLKQDEACDSANITA